MKEKKDRKGIILTLFIAFIMITSVLGFVFSGDNSQSSVEYNGYTFTRTENGWASYIRDQYLYFTYSPADLTSDPFNVFSINSEKVYIAYNPSEMDVVLQNSIDRLRYIFSLNGIIAHPACSIEDGCPDIPIVNCDDGFPIISFRKSDQNRISTDGTCIVLEGYFVKNTDRLSYWLLGVM